MTTKFTRRHLFLAVLFAIATCSYLDKQIFIVLMEPLKAEFSLSDAKLGVLTGLAFALLYGVMSFPIARWADRGDRKMILTVALAAWSAATIACGLTRNFLSLAAARLGVGAAEAGLIPPAQSLLADYYPPQQRGTAIGIFMMSATVGGMLAIAIGGWLVEQVGWRYTLFIAGAPGLPLAVAAFFILKEPRAATLKAPIAASEPIAEALRALWRKPTYFYGLTAKILYFLISHGPVAFLVSFMVRSHGLSVTRAGALYGAIVGISGIGSYLIGGWLADRLLARSGEAALCRMPGWTLVLACPFYLCALLVGNLYVMAAALLVATFLLNASSPAMFSVLHLVCGGARRALAVALVFCLSNLIGLGLGPVITGATSDVLAASLGSSDGLRIAIALMTLALPLAGICMFRAAANISADREP